MSGLGSDSAAERRRACLAMPSDHERLVELLEDANAEVREAACWALKNAAPPIDVLLRAPLERIAEIGSVIAPRLDASDRATIATALLDRMTAAEPKVIAAIAVLASPALLVGALASSGSDARRLAAASALAAGFGTGTDTALRPDPAHGTRTALLRARLDPHPEVRAAIARALAFAGAVEDLRPMLDDADASVRVAAAEAIARTAHHERALEVAVAGIASPDPLLRSSAARALALFAQHQLDLISPLIDLLFDPSYEVHVACAGGLAALGPSAADLGAETLLRSVILPRPNGAFLISIHAILALSRMAPATIPLLRRTLTTHDDPRFRAAAATALGEIGTEAREAIPDLRSALDDRVWLVGLRAAAAVITAGELELGTAHLLRQAEHEADPQVRLQTAFVLGRLPLFRDELFAALVTLVGDPDPEVRFQAVESLGRWGELAMPAIEAVRASLEDPHARVRRQALRSLEDILLTRERRRLVMIQQ